MGWTYGAFVGGLRENVSRDCFAVCIRSMQERKHSEVEELCRCPHGGDGEVFWRKANLYNWELVKRPESLEMTQMADGRWQIPDCKVSSGLAVVYIY